MNFCPLCKSTSNELLFSNSRGNKYLENYVCDNCGFIYTFPRISNEEINRLYLEGGFSKEARKASIPNLEKFIETESLALDRMHWLEKKIPSFFLSQKSCLELGCGTGSFSWLLKSRGHLVKAIEPDSVFVNVAFKRYSIDVESILFEDFDNAQLFDLICNFHVIEHVLDPRKFVQEMYSKLKEDGIVYIECPTIDNIYTGDLNTFFWDVHVNTFSNKSLPWLLESEGFSIVEVFMNDNYLSVIAKKGVAIGFEKENKERIINVLKMNDIKISEKSFFQKLKGKIKSKIKKYFRC